MTTLRDPFPDVEQALFRAFRTPGLIDPVAGGTITSSPSFTTAEAEPVTGYNAHIMVALIDSPDDGYTMRAVVDISVFAASRSVGYAVAEQVRGIMLSARSLDGVVIDRVLTVSGPKQVPWDNPRIRRFLATYRISTRR